MRATVLLTCLPAVVLTLGACGSSGQVETSDPASVGPASVSPSGTASASATTAVPTAVPTQLPPAPSAQAKTQQSANAFATYVALLDYRIVYTRDVAPLLALVAPGTRCKECEKAKRDVQSGDPLYAVPAGEPKILDTAPRSSHGDEYVVGVAYETPAAKVLAPSGKVVGDLEGYPNNYTEVRMTWDEAAATWRLLDYHVQKGAGDV